MSVDLTRDSEPDRWRHLQSDLLALGHAPGPIDGLPGPKTFGALDAMMTTTQADVARFKAVPGWLADGIHRAASGDLSSVLTPGAAPPSTSAIVGGGDVEAPPGLDWINYRDPSVPKLRGKGLRDKTTIVLHESVTRTWHQAANVLMRRHLGVQVMVTRDGKIRQTQDIKSICAHAGAGKNGSSLGVEVVGPYYGSRAVKGDTVIKGPSFHKGRYIVPPVVQLEATYQLVIWLAELLEIPVTFPGLAVNDLFVWGRVKGGYRPGIAAHCRWAHADALVPEHFIICRHRGHDIDTAYIRTLKAAETGSRSNGTREHWS